MGEVQPDQCGGGALRHARPVEPFPQPLPSIHAANGRRFGYRCQEPIYELNAPTATSPVVPVFVPQMNAKYLLRENIKSLLRARKEDASTLASWLNHDKSWINKILNGHREMQIEDFDRVADFFGIATYQLFQPGISSLTERRISSERRSGKERRIGQTQRAMLTTAGEIERARPGRKGRSSHVAVVASSPLAEALDRAAADHAKRIDAIISRFTDARDETPTTRRKITATRPRGRTPGGSDIETA